RRFADRSQRAGRRWRHVRHPFLAPLPKDAPHGITGRGPLDWMHSEEAPLEQRLGIEWDRRQKLQPHAGAGRWLVVDVDETVADRTSADAEQDIHLHGQRTEVFGHAEVSGPG